VEGQQWTTVTNKKSKDKVKASFCNVVCASSWEAKTDDPSLTNLVEETIVLVAELNKSLVAEARSGQSYLKKYDEMVESPPKPIAKPTKPSTKQPMEKQKELQFSKNLLKNNTEGSPTLYRFDVLAQLANIPARITHYELLRLSKSTREALREALTDAEVFMAQIPARPQEEDEEGYLHAFKVPPA